jgi:hypothetical protein
MAALDQVLSDVKELSTDDKLSLVRHVLSDLRQANPSQEIVIRNDGSDPVCY